MHRIRPAIARALVGLPFVAALAAPARAQDLTVSAAISLKEAVGEIASAFEAANSGVSINLNLGASGDLQRQIEAGALVDVFLSAASTQMDALQRRGAIDPRTRRDVACNRLVVVTPAEDGATLEGLEDLASVERIAIGSPRTVPAGQYAQEALRSAGQWEALQPKLIFAENVRQALEYVARGETEAGFVYRTDASLLPEDVRIGFEVDPSLHQPIVYPAAVVAGSAHRELAQAFVQFLSAPETGATLVEHGFSLPPCR